MKRRYIPYDSDRAREIRTKMDGLMFQMVGADSEQRGLVIQRYRVLRRQHESETGRDYQSPPNGSMEK
jgi:hypothetical protein